ncbi:MAG: class I SAM-dependent methyltransferase, partial [Candidatus Thiodiazotropha endolucinida]|nr:class I SAM-dependent methyltransferase [Candidatus Thiodiazotropha taylori]MCW4241482.1 class I SAM-dependent methyltransferase [Candidatus Thiodiazotropha taylori]
MNQANKPYAEACDENKVPILDQLLRLFSETRSVLEIGSGTGQHGVFFAAAMPDLTWQTSDREENHEGIQAWLSEAALGNLLSPLTLDVTSEWPKSRYDAVFSANTTHIMSWPAVIALFQGVGRVLQAEGRFVRDGPFNYQGAFTSESNSRFDEWLRSRMPLNGSRD